MYRVYTVLDTVRIPPDHFSMELNEGVKRILREKYERKIYPNAGIVLAISNVKDIGEGKVILGDGAAYHDVTFDALAYSPEIGEIFQGDVTNVVEFGCFIRMGPFEGLTHLSQITNDFLSYDKKTASLVAKKTKRTLKKGDEVFAKTTTVSMKNVISETKIGLTMRPLGLGRKEWVDEDMELEGKEAAAKQKKGEKEEKEKEPRQGKEEKKEKKKKRERE